MSGEGEGGREKLLYNAARGASIMDEDLRELESRARMYAARKGVEWSSIHRIVSASPWSVMVTWSYVET